MSEKADQDVKPHDAIDPHESATPPGHPSEQNPADLPRGPAGAFAPQPRVIHGLMMEFDDPHNLLDAARRLKDDGYSEMDAYTPFPMDELPEILGWPRSRMPAVILAAGILGGLGGFFMLWFANVVSYRINVGGRPLNSWPAWIPITFECTVLCAGLAGGIVMLLRNGLPRPHHPIFDIPGIERSGIDRFFLIVEAVDPKFDADRTRQFVDGLDPLRVIEVNQ